MEAHNHLDNGRLGMAWTNALASDRPRRATGTRTARMRRALVAGSLSAALMAPATAMATEPNAAGYNQTPPPPTTTTTVTTTENPISPIKASRAASVARSIRTPA